VPHASHSALTTTLGPLHTAEQHSHLLPPAATLLFLFLPVFQSYFNFGLQLHGKCETVGRNVRHFVEMTSNFLSLQFLSL